MSYLIGSIPTSIIAGKLLRGIDIRDFGSGNAGGTNAFRVLGWKTGLTVTILDIIKGAIAAISVVVFFEAHPLGPLPDINPIALRLIAGLSAVFGHVFTVFAGFKGGKGVSTAAGMMFGIAPVTTLIVLGIFLLVIFISRYVSVASMLAAIAFPMIIAIRKYLFDLGSFKNYYFDLFNTSVYIRDSLDYHLLIFGLIVALAIIYTHRENIRRLFSGNENRVKFHGHS